MLNVDNAESRKVVESCYRTTSTMVNPIVDWEDDEVWEFLHYYGCESNPLYQCGFKRIGCIGCPFGGPASMRRGFMRYPKYQNIYIKAFDRMLAERTKCGLDNRDWHTGRDVFRWWIGENPNQLTLFDDEYEEG